MVSVDEVARMALYLPQVSVGRSHGTHTWTVAGRTMRIRRLPALLGVSILFLCSMVGLRDTLVGGSGNDALAGPDVLIGRDGDDLA